MAAPPEGIADAPRADLRSLWRLLRPHRPALAVAVTLAFAGAAAALAQPLLARRVITAIEDDQDVAGLAVVLISSELNELAGMADRVLVMSQGRIEAELTEGFDEEGMLRVLHDLEDQPHAQGQALDRVA